MKIKASKRVSFNRSSPNRRGVTAVEFALVAPVAFLLIFFIFELARLMLFAGNVNTALLTGVRHATLDSATATEVEEIIRSELIRTGITVDPTINITPPDFTAFDSTVQIEIDIPLSTFVGVNLTTLNRDLTIDRE